MAITSWSGKPDSIRTKRIFPQFQYVLDVCLSFQNQSQWSVAIGPGISTDHINMDEMYVGIKDATDAVVSKMFSDTNHFRKYKLATAYLEAPVELRFTLYPERRSSFKVALGAKVGTILSAWVKGKELQDKNDVTLLDYIAKEKSKQFFNSTRLSVMGRIGYGNFNIYGSYAITSLFKEGLGPQVKPWSIGITLSGL
jgi:hypothetical protein